MRYDIYNLHYQLRLEPITGEDILKENPNLERINDGSEVFVDNFADNQVSKLFGNMSDSLLQASCECRNLRDIFWDDGYTRCPKCGEFCTSHNANKITFHAYIGIDDPLPPIIQPRVYATLNSYLGGRSKDVLATLMDHKTEIDELLLSELKKHLPKFKRSFVYFHENFDAIMEFFLYTYIPTSIKGKKAAQAKQIKDYLERFRDKVFMRIIPVVDPIVHSVNTSDNKRFRNTSDKSCKELLQIYNEVMRLQREHDRGLLKERKLNTIICKIQQSYCRYTKLIADEKIAKKQGEIRTAIMGGEVHVSARGVIIPLGIGLDGDCIQLPWGHGVASYKPAILNILINRKGYTFIDALKLHQRALVSRDEVIADCLQILIDESPFKGLPVIIDRNPTMILGGEQLVFITKFKDDITDKNISVHAMILKAPNGDYDGDELNLFILTEIRMAEYFALCHPKYTMLDYSEPGLSHHVTLTAPATHMLHIWNTYERPKGYTPTIRRKKCSEET